MKLNKKSFIRTPGLLDPKMSCRTNVTGLFEILQVTTGGFRFVAFWWRYFSIFYFNILIFFFFFNLFKSCI